MSPRPALGVDTARFTRTIVTIRSDSVDSLFLRIGIFCVSGRYTLYCMVTVPDPGYGVVRRGCSCCERRAISHGFGARPLS